MNVNKVKEILEKIRNVKIAVYGDFCIDAYWILDPGGGEISVETGLQTQAVKSHYYTLGGASNIVANLAALKPAHIKTIGVIGDDIYGRELFHQLEQLKVDTSTMVVQKENYDTVTFGKRYLENDEQPRVDFGFFNKRSEDTNDRILQYLHATMQDYDVLIFNQQVPGSLDDNGFIAGANQLLNQFNEKIVLFDSRHYGHHFKNIYRKVNSVEAAQLNGLDAKPDDIIPLANVRMYARHLSEQSQKPVFVTLGAQGILVADDTDIHEIPGVQLKGKLDAVGAGDTTICALALSLAAGYTPVDAANFANLAAAVTVKKLYQTGTASGDEIIEIYKKINI